MALDQRECYREIHIPLIAVEVDRLSGWWWPQVSRESLTYLLLRVLSLVSGLWLPYFFVVLLSLAKTRERSAMSLSAVGNPTHYVKTRT